MARLVHRKKLLRLMVIADLSGRQLARDVRYRSHSHMQRVLRGEKPGFREDVAQRIAERLGVAFADLFVPEVSNQLDTMSDGEDGE